MKQDSKIFIAGARGLVGSSIVRLLRKEGYTNLLKPNSLHLDLVNQQQVSDYFDWHKPEYVFLAAAKVGGIMANATYPADFIYNNLMIQSNVINASHHSKVKKLLFLGSSCIYPKNCPQPMKEEHLLTGSLEETNKSYAIAKIAGLIACEAYNKQHGDMFISAMPTNLYGPGDNFNLENSHLLPALIRKFHDAKKDHHAPVTLWGSGNPKRELMHVDDLASACLMLMHQYEDSSPINVGTGVDKSVREIANMVQEVVEHRGSIAWDSSKPDGTMKKCLDTNKITKLGWKPNVSLTDGIKSTYDWWLKHCNTARK